MRLEVAGYTAIRKQSDRIPHVRGVSHRVLDRKLRRQAHHIDPLDGAIAQQILKAGAAERAIGVAGDKNFAVAWFEAFISGSPPGALLQRSQLLRFCEKAAVARKIGKVRGEDNVHVGNCPTRAPRRFKRAPAPVEELRSGTRAAMKRKRD